jgi:hypothetical protein
MSKKFNGTGGKLDLGPTGTVGAHFMKKNQSVVCFLAHGTIPITYRYLYQMRPV